MWWFLSGVLSFPLWGWVYWEITEQNNRGMKDHVSLQHVLQLIGIFLVSVALGAASLLFAIAVAGIEAWIRFKPDEIVLWKRKEG